VRLDRRAERLPEWLREARRALDLAPEDRHLRLAALAGWQPRPGDAPPHGDKAEAAQAWVRFWEESYKSPDMDGLIATAALLHLAEAGWLPSGPSPERVREEFHQRGQQYLISYHDRSVLRMLLASVGTRAGFQPPPVPPAIQVSPGFPIAYPCGSGPVVFRCGRPCHRELQESGARCSRFATRSGSTRPVHHVPPAGDRRFRVKPGRTRKVRQRQVAAPGATRRAPDGWGNRCPRRAGRPAPPCGRGPSSILHARHRTPFHSMPIFPGEYKKIN